MMIAAVAIPLAAGEYSAWSPGIQLQLSQATGNTFVPFQSQTGNIQGATVDTLYGIGFANQVRMGEAFSWRLRSLALMPTLGFQVGNKSESRHDSNFVFTAPDGSLANVQNADSHRKTQTREISLVVPVRWYTSGSAAAGGFYVEAGPAIFRTEQTVDLQVAGYVNSVPASLAESAKISANEGGFVVGLGFANLYRESQFSYGITFQQVSTSKDVQITPNQIRVYVQWTF